MSTWFVEQRIQWIDECIRIFGFINRHHLQDKFDISTPQASLDFREYMRRFPDKIKYNTSTKQYERQAPE